MKTGIRQWMQKFLQKVGLYHRIKASRLYDWYWMVLDKAILQEKVEEYAFYRKTLSELQPGDLVIDVGANQGFKTEIFIRLGARVVAVDPDTANQEVLAQKFTRMRLIPKPVSIVGRALGEKVGMATMFINEPGSAKNTLNPKWVETLGNNNERFGEKLAFAQARRVDVTTLEELVREHGVPYYVKVDVEGYEAMVIKGLKWAVPLLSFEVNLPEFLPEARECIGMLDSIDPLGRWNFIAGCAGGFLLREWGTKLDMLAVLESCAHPTIEIFWQSPAGRKRMHGVDNSKRRLP